VLVEALLLNVTLWSATMSPSALGTTLTCGRAGCEVCSVAVEVVAAVGLKVQDCANDAVSVPSGCGLVSWKSSCGACPSAPWLISVICPFLPDPST
jgi:hypothetical protein